MMPPCCLKNGGNTLFLLSLFEKDVKKKWMVNESKFDLLTNNQIFKVLNFIF